MARRGHGALLLVLTIFVVAGASAAEQQVELPSACLRKFAH